MPIHTRSPYTQRPGRTQRSLLAQRCSERCGCLSTEEREFRWKILHFLQKFTHARFRLLEIRDWLRNLRGARADNAEENRGVHRTPFMAGFFELFGARAMMSDMVDDDVVIGGKRFLMKKYVYLFTIYIWNELIVFQSKLYGPYASSISWLHSTNVDTIH